MIWKQVSNIYFVVHHSASVHQAYVHQLFTSRETIWEREYGFLEKAISVRISYLLFLLMGTSWHYQGHCCVFTSLLCASWHVFQVCWFKSSEFKLIDHYSRQIFKHPCWPACQTFKIFRKRSTVGANIICIRQSRSSTCLNHGL